VGLLLTLGFGFGIWAGGLGYRVWGLRFKFWDQRGGAFGLRVWVPGRGKRAGDVKEIDRVNMLQLRVRDLGVEVSGSGQLEGKESRR
jgi:hypothetical protein